MKRLISFIVLLVASQAAHAEVLTRVCLADGNTPLELADPCIPYVYRPIMVGTHLTIIISSDTNSAEWFGGALTLWDANLDYGVLPGGLPLPAAGPNAIVYPWIDSSEEHYVEGLAFGGGRNPSIGDWFIVDYNAISMGNCSVFFYDWDVSLDPLYQMSFTHVGTRDFNDDGIVNFEDFAVLGSNWQRTDCSGPQNCSGTDLDADGHVGISDLIQFAEYWLEKTR